MNSDRIVEATTSGAVTVSFSPSWLVTVEFVSAERPRSPCSTPPIHSKYCVDSGRFEAEVLADLRDPLGRGLDAADDAGEVAGQQPQQDEDHHARHQQGDQQQPEAAEAEPEHERSA